MATQQILTTYYRTLSDAYLAAREHGATTRGAWRAHDRAMAEMLRRPEVAAAVRYA